LCGDVMDRERIRGREFAVKDQGDGLSPQGLSTMFEKNRMKKLPRDGD